jgi:hypothetical protein
MVKWMFPIAVFMCVGTAQAADKIMSRLSTEKTDSGTSADISFAYASCEEECQIATLSCRESGSVGLVLADIDAKIAAKAMTAEKAQIMLKAGSKTYDYYISDMQFAELSGAWWLTAHEQGSKAGEIAAAIGAAKNVEARVGGKKIVLPMDANLKAWAQSCK